MKALAAKLGVNYVWGLVNFTAGVVLASFFLGFSWGLYHGPCH